MQRRALAVALLVAVVGCGPGGKKTPAQPVQTPPVSVGAENVARVNLTTLVAGPAVSGTLQPENVAEVRSQMAGQIASVTGREGQSVESGQVVARIDDSSIRDQVASAETAVKSAEANVELGKRNEDRYLRLQHEGAISKQDLETAQQQRLGAEASLAQARSLYAAALKDRDRTVLRAPFAGVISARKANPGDVVQPGSPIFTVVDPSLLVFEASVPAASLSDIRVSSQVDFDITGYSRPFQGKVERINPIVDPATGQVRIYVSVPNPQGALVAGLFAQGRVASQSIKAPAVPSDAIDDSGIRPQLATVKDNKVARVEVQRGLTDSMTEQVAVPGVAPGTLVLRGSARSLAQDTPLQITAPPPEPPSQQPLDDPPGAR